MKNQIKKLLLLVTAIVALTVCMAFGVSALDVTGQCGDNVAWIFEHETGMVTIKGEGDMYDYSLGMSPFYQNIDIKNVIIEDGVTSVGDNAFIDCKNLCSITVGNSVEIIGESAFKGCIKNSEVTFGNNVETIEAYAFCNNVKLEKIVFPDSLKELGSGALLYVPLKNIIIPAFIEDLDEMLLSTYLESITVSEANQYYSSDEGVLFNKDKTILIQYPSNNARISYSILDGVKTIEQGAFYGADNLENIYIPDSVTDIAKETFEWCTSLKSISIPGSITTICQEMFFNCNSLENVVIGEGVEEIDDMAFALCSSLKTVELPDSVTAIGECAFESCTSLENIILGDAIAIIGTEAFVNCENLKTVSIGKNTQTIENGVFSGCVKLESITVDSENEYYSSDEFGVLYDKDKTILLQYPAGAESTSYVLPDSVVSIPARAFYACKNLKNLKLSDNVSTIGDEAFAYCGNLEILTLGKSVETIGLNAFYECDSISDITVSDDNENFSGDDGILYNKDRTKLIRYFEGSGRTTYTVADEVEEICENAFASSKSLTGVTIPSSVKTIGEKAFKKCKKLSTVVMEEGLLKIEREAFSGCTELYNINLPDSVKSIKYGVFNSTFYYNNESNWIDGVLYCGKHLIEAKDDIVECDVKTGTKVIASYAFSGCNELESLNIPDGVVTIDDYAIFECNGLTCLTLPDSLETVGQQGISCCFYITNISFGSGLKEIENSAFAYNKRIKSIVIPDSVTKIEASAFSGCESLTTAVIPGTVNLGHSIFEDCIGLTNVTIGEGITVIPEKMFYGCLGLVSVALPKSVTSIEADAFNGCKGIETLTLEKNINKIAGSAFKNCINIKDVYYSGTKSGWGRIDIGYNNENLENANIHVHKHTDENADNVCDVCKELCSGIILGEPLIINGEKECIEFKAKDSGIYDFDITSLSGDLYRYYITDEEDNIIPNRNNDDGDGCSLIVEFIEGNVYYLCVEMNSFGKAEILLTCTQMYCKHKTTTDYAEISNSCTNEGYTAGVFCEECQTWISGHETISRHSDENKDGCCDSCSAGISDIYPGQRKTITISDEETVLLKFIPTQSGKYSYRSYDSEWITTGLLYDADMNLLKSGEAHSEFLIRYDFEKGKTYYLGVTYNRGNLEQPTTAEFEVSLTLDEAHCNHDETVEVSEKAPDCINYGNTAGTKCAVCGSFVTAEVVGALGHTDDNNDDICDVCGQPASDIIVGVPLAVDTNEEIYLKFIPTATGVYTLTANGSGCDNFARLYDSDDNQLAYNDDDGTGLNFSLTYTLEKGQTYYLKVSCYDLAEFDEGCEFDIILTFAEELHTHSYTSTTKSPTCTAVGTTTYTCFCGDTYTETIKAKGHTAITDKAVAATCTKTGLTAGSHCSVCKAVITKQTVTAKKAHTSDSGTVTKKATYKATGTKTYKCTACKVVLKTEEVARLNLSKVNGLKASSIKTTSIKFTWSKVTDAEKYEVYYSTNGKKWTKVTTSKNSVTIKKLKSGTTYKVKVRAVVGDNKGSYSSVLTTSTKPSKVTLSKLTAGKKKLTGQWKTVNGATGYEVTYSTSKKFTKKTTKTVTVKKAKTKKTTLKKLKSGKKYYVKVRAYKTVNGKRIYGVYSAVKTVKIK